jgi:protoheme IX farnesyltransferase
VGDGDGPTLVQGPGQERAAEDVRAAAPVRGLRAFAVAAALATYLIVVVTGLVPAAGAALTGGFRLAAALAGGLSLALVAVLAGARSVADAGVVAQAEQAARRLALVAAIAVLFQALLGALVRGSGAALACPDFPFCRDTAWSLADDAVAVRLQLVHRLGALTAAVLVFAAAVRTLRAAAGRPWLRALAIATPVLAAAQVSLGARSVRTFLDLAAVQAHLVVGAALLAASFGLYALSTPARAPGAAPTAAPAWPSTALLRALVELAKPRITTLVVITFAGGLWLAPGSVEPWRRLGALVGTVLLVAAANALNMYLERDLDALMVRTRHRPLPEGRVSPEAAIGFGTALACIALPLLLVSANVLTAALGLLAFVLYVFAYTPLKPLSSVALFVGAVPGAMPPLMGWTTASGRLDAGGLALFAILFVWQVPHFLAIALYRSEDYARGGFRVLPLSAGAPATRWHIIVSTAVMVLVSALPALFGTAGAAYLVAALGLGAWFLASTLRPFDAAPAATWGRKVFLTSLGYLTALFVALSVGHWLR